MADLKEGNLKVDCMAYLSQGMPLSQNLLATLHAAQAVLLLPGAGRAPELGSMGTQAVSASSA